MKIMTLALSALLALAAAGRYNVEADVRERERNLGELQEAVRVVERDVAKVRLDVEVLESASRLSELNSSHLALKTVQAGQLLDEEAFADMVGISAPPRAPVLAPDVDVIGNAIGMADMRIAARELNDERDAE